MSRQRLLAASLVLALLVCGVAPASGAAANPCIDGGRTRPDEGGIGGTGARPKSPGEDDSGIGGTGISAAGETGVIGTITGFASICVGETEIHYGAGTAVRIDDAAATPAQLAVGQVVEVIASSTGSALRAKRVSVRHLVSGPVTAVDAARNRIQVMGQTVQLSPMTRGGSGAEQFAAAADFPQSTFVKISGMRRGDGLIAASRVVRGGASETAELNGAVTARAAGRLAVAGTPVRLEREESIAVGDQVRVAGRWNGDTLVARSVQRLPALPFAGRVVRLEIEGFAQRISAGRLQIGSFAVDVPPSAWPGGATPPEDTRIRVHAVVRHGEMRAERIGLVRELPSPPHPPRGMAPELREGQGGDWRGGAERPGRSAGGAPPEISGRPDRPPMPEAPGEPDVPSVPELPGRPDRIDRPVPPDRPSLPERPSLPDRPSLPERPARPELPSIPHPPPRPELPDRP